MNDFVWQKLVDKVQAMNGISIRWENYQLGQMTIVFNNARLEHEAFVLAQILLSKGYRIQFLTRSTDNPNLQIHIWL